MMESAGSKFKISDAVIVAVENPTGNPRTPKYIRGKRGVVGSVHGILENIRDHRGIHKPLYTVKFDLSEVSTCHDQDSIWVDVHEEWLSAHRSGRRYLRGVKEELGNRWSTKSYRRSRQAQKESVV